MNLEESVTRTWSISLPCSTPSIPILEEFCTVPTPHNVYPSYSAAMFLRDFFYRETCPTVNPERENCFAQSLQSMCSTASLWFGVYNYLKGIARQPAKSDTCQ